MYFSKGGGSQIFEVNDAMYIWIFCAIFFLVVVSIVVVFLSKYFSKFLIGLYYFFILLFIYCVSQGVYLFLSYKNKIQILQYTLKIPYFYDFSWVNGLNKIGYSVFPKNSIEQKLHKILSNDEKLHYPLHPLQYHLPKHPLNVLLIVVDTLRYDMINASDMPNVYQFSQHATQFLNNFSGGDCTKAGIFSLFYGIPVIYWKGALAYHYPSILIKAFNENHYQFGIFASAPLTSPAFDQTVFYGLKNYPTMTKGVTALDRDGQITHKMTRFLDNVAKNKKPFFGFVFYDLPHAYNALTLNKPFHPIANLNYFSISKHIDATPIFNLYKNAVFKDDQLISLLFQNLKKNHLLKNTVVIITSDHGQEFNENHNHYWEHASGFSKYQIKTPLIVYWPNRPLKKIHDMTTHFDLAPTLLEKILKVKNTALDYSFGHNLFSKHRHHFLIIGNYAYFALIQQHKIMEFHSSGLYQMTDLYMHFLRENEEENTNLNDMTRFIEKFY